MWVAGTFLLSFTHNFCLFKRSTTNSCLNNINLFTALVILVFCKQKLFFQQNSFRSSILRKGRQLLSTLKCFTYIRQGKDESKRIEGMWRLMYFKIHFLKSMKLKFALFLEKERMFTIPWRMYKTRNIWRIAETN